MAGGFKSVAKQMPTVSTHQDDAVESKRSSSGTQDWSCAVCRRKSVHLERGDGSALHQLECCSFAYLLFHLSGLVEQEEDQSHTIKEARGPAGHCNDVYSPADDMSWLKWPRRDTAVMMEVSKETRGGIYLTIEEVAPHGEEPSEIVMNDQVLYHAGDLVIPARPDAGVDMRQGPSGPGPRPDNRGDAIKENHGEDDPMEGKSVKMSEFDLGALERDLLDYDFDKKEGGGANETVVPMTLAFHQERRVQAAQ